MTVLAPDEAARWIEPGMRVGIGGLQGNHPMAMIRALARAGIGELDLVGPPVGMAPEFLVASGLVRSLAAPGMAAEGVIPVAPAFRDAAQQGDLEIWECDEAILLTALRAAGQDLPYLPWRGGYGTDVVALNDDLVEYEDPATGTQLVRVPPLRLDVALLRGLEADEHGNVRYMNHSTFADPTIARAADRVIVEVERLIPHEEVLADPGRTVIHRADAVVVAPFGSHPFRAAGVLEQDGEWLRAWNAEIRNALAEGLPLREAQMLGRLLALNDETEYIDLIGRDRLAELALDRPGAA